MGSEDSHPRSSGYPIQAGQGERLALAGATVTIKAGSAATGGAVEVFEIHVPAHARPSEPHQHKDATEVFYVLEGALAFTLDDRTFVAQRGSVIWAPPGAAYDYWNPTASSATLLNICVPGGSEAHFRELAARVNSLDTPDPSSSESM